MPSSQQLDSPEETWFAQSPDPSPSVPPATKVEKFEVAKANKITLNLRKSGNSQRSRQRGSPKISSRGVSSRSRSPSVSREIKHDPSENSSDSSAQTKPNFGLALSHWQQDSLSPERSSRGVSSSRSQSPSALRSDQEDAPVPGFELMYVLSHIFSTLSSDWPSFRCLLDLVYNQKLNATCGVSEEFFLNVKFICGQEKKNALFLGQVWLSVFF